MNIEERIASLEERVTALEPVKFRKPSPTSFTPGPCDCDLYGVLHVMQPECPVWENPADAQDSPIWAKA